MRIFIPIKKESQRVPNKNFRIFTDDLPLYKYVLLKYKKHDVYVDTDSEELIETISSDPELKHVTAYPRHRGNIGHEIPVTDLIRWYINKYRVDDREYITQLHVTSPFLTCETVERAYKCLCEEKSEFNSAVSYTKHQTRFWRKEEYGLCPVNHNPLNLEQTQDLPAYYEENSCFYIFTAKQIKTSTNRIGDRPLFIETKFPEHLDIDTEDDWLQCKAVATLK